jgi:CBS domain-containing protein
VPVDQGRSTLIGSVSAPDDGLVMNEDGAGCRSRWSKGGAMNRRVRDVMSAPVVTVTDSAGFKEIVGLMQKHGVSALPVVDGDRRLVGIVSEADLLLKEEYATEGTSRERLLDFRWRKSERAKAAGTFAAQLMSRPVVTVEPEATLAKAARLIHEEKVRRLPVVDADGRVVGIVSRADLLKVFLRSDAEIHDDVKESVLRRALWLEPHDVKVTVRDGVVLLKGQVEQRSMIPLVVELASDVEGVVGVDSRLDYEVDDESARPLPFGWGIPTPHRMY